MKPGLLGVTARLYPILLLMDLITLIGIGCKIGEVGKEVEVVVKGVEIDFS